MKKSYKFIDLFAGLGGFNLALNQLGHECIFASEIDTTLSNLYKKNFNIDPKRDIRNVKTEDIPKHDILCAGFPCTPFSKAGKRSGKDHSQGDLFGEIVRILKSHRPKYFILENVPSLLTHLDKEGNNIWIEFEDILKNDLKYYVKKARYSPHEFGIPQHRNRIFVIGSIHSLDYFNWIDEYKIKVKTSINSILENGKSLVKKISIEQNKCIEVWQEFLDLIPSNLPLPFPIWAAEFKATYPFESKTPYSLRYNILARYKGSFGESLKGLSKNEQLLKLPSYARTEQEEFPDWKKNFIRLNRNLYSENKKQIDKVLLKIKNLPVPSWQKFEWNCRENPRIIKNYILQFRSSGLRVKNNDVAPSLVCPLTQRPIIGWEERYISVKEALKLQCMEDLKFLPPLESTSYRALGNAVNVKIIKLIAKNLIK